jgi:hypothetical protein
MHSEGGHPFYVLRWEMPRIKDTILDCVFYLYRSVQEAKDSEHAGGTGFLVGVPDSLDPKSDHVYGVTNRHVIRRGATVIRLNTEAGETDTLNLTKDHWAFHPDGDDIAATYLGRSGQRTPVRARYWGVDKFLTPEVIKREDVGPGDEVFMVGRFKEVAGERQNRPTARFGNISRMHDGDPICDPETGFRYESFLVEVRSLSGYSGSPVFVHFLPGVPRRHGAMMVSYEMGGPGPWLLGVDWAHLAPWEKVKQKDEEQDTEEGYVVRSHSGVLAVAPAWQVLETINQEDFMKDRIADDKQRARERAQSSVVLDSADDDASTAPGPDPERLKIKGDWERAVRKGLKKGRP